MSVLDDLVNGARKREAQRVAGERGKFLGSVIKALGQELFDALNATIPQEGAMRLLFEYRGRRFELWPGRDSRYNDIFQVKVFGDVTTVVGSAEDLLLYMAKNAPEEAK